MNCQEAKNLFDDAIDRALAGARKRKFDLHLQHCPACRALYDAEVREHALLFRALNEPAAGERLPSRGRMVERLLVARNGAAGRPWFRRMPRWTKVAAALALFAGGYAFAKQVVVWADERAEAARQVDQEFQSDNDTKGENNMVENQNAVMSGGNASVAVSNGGRLSAAARTGLCAAMTALAVQGGRAEGNAYANDFVERSSPAPEGWHVMNYRPGSLLYAYDRNATYTATLPYAVPADMQDGWIKRYCGKGVWNAGFSVATNSAAEVAGADTTNPFGAFTGSTGAGCTVAIHPLCNAFSNGILRLQADMRAPGHMQYNGNVGDQVGAQLRIFPLYEQHMNPGLGSLTEYAPAAFGPNKAKNSDIYPCCLYGSPVGKAAGLTTATSFAPLHWYRYQADFDLAASTFTLRYEDLGVDSPTFETEGTLVKSWSNLGFYKAMTATTGPVTGIGIWGSGVDCYTDGSLVVTNAPAIDNIRVAWKAPGASDFTVAYENDFAQRRVRAIEPAPTAQHVYEKAVVPAHESVYTGYYQNMHLVPFLGVWPTAERAVFNTIPSYPGYDGWRRLDHTGLADVYIGAKDGGLNMFIHGPSAFGGVAHSLGREITSGKVRLSVDLKTPDSWSWSAWRGMYACWGEPGMYTAIAKDFEKRMMVGPGIGGNSASTFYPDGYMCGKYSGGPSLTADTWYRVDTVVDLDANPQTYTFTLTPLTVAEAVAGSAPSAASVFTYSGATDNAQVKSIGTVALFGWGQLLYFDNVKVWENVGEASETLVYSNDFSRRMRLVPEMEKGVLLAGTDRTYGAQDGWVRRDAGQGDVAVLGDETPILSIGDVSGSQYVQAVHPLGVSVVGDIVSFQFDLRPPEAWDSENGAIELQLGDDTLYQGNINPNTHYSEGIALKLGVGERPFWEKTETKNYVNGGIYAFDGGTKKWLTESMRLGLRHWLRFSVKIDRGKGTYDLSVCDLGAEFPDADSATGTPVASATGLALTGPLPRNAPALGVRATGFLPLGEDALLTDGGRALIDNVRFWPRPGYMMIVR